MPVDGEADLAQRARAVLDHNWRAGHTCPSSDLYPHQWLWDSSFTAIGLATYEPERGMTELRSLLRGQWANGMVPHMVFADGTRDMGSTRIWRSRRFADAPSDVATSCITQPPVIAVAALHVARRLPDATAAAFLAEILPNLVAYHSWLYRERDPGQTGLVTLVHPWECGLDTTPPWMRRLRRMHEPWWVRLTMRLGLDRLARRFRRDTRLVPAEERSSDHDGLRMLALAHHIRRHDFDLRRLPRDTSVLVEDVAFNALLAAANRALAEIAGRVGTEIPAELATSARRTVAALDELWDDRTGQYCSRDAVTRRPIRIPTVATFLPLWAGIPAARVQALTAMLREPSGFWPPHPIPSVATDAPQYDEDRYWKGPTWVNTNWVVIRGLEHSGEAGLAGELRRRTLELVARAGFSEYFSALTGTGHGADDFSWTAALVLDLLDDS